MCCVGGRRRCRCVLCAVWEVDIDVGVCFVCCVGGRHRCRCVFCVLCGRQT